MIDKARQNFRDLPNFHFIVANSESVPLNDSQLDIIICTNSFHHYFHPINALGEMRRLLRPGGKLYILDPTADTLFVKFLGRVMHIFESSAVKLYSTEEFQELFLMSNLKYLRTEALNRHEKVHIGEK